MDFGFFLWFLFSCSRVVIKKSSNAMTTLFVQKAEVLLKTCHFALNPHCEQKKKIPTIGLQKFLTLSLDIPAKC
jgi:hypothetical protein